MDLEVLGTSAVKDAIAMTDYLSPYVNDKDKEPLWDGHIYAYSDSSKKNNCFIGRAPVQVKGKKSTDLTKQKIKYSIPFINLEKYRLDGGTIFFVVLINELCEKKIYYNALLPFEINKLLDCKEKSNISITLYKLPMKKNEIANMVINFVKDRDKQVLLRNGKNITYEELLKQSDPRNIKLGFSYTGYGYDIEKPYEYLFNHDIYMYAINKKLNITIPIDHIWRANIAKYQVSGIVQIGDIEYYKGYKVVHKVDLDELHIGKSVVFKLNEDVAEVKYNLKGNLKERIVALNFMNALMTEKNVIINGAKLEMNPTQEEIQTFRENEIEKQIEHLCDVQCVLDQLGVQEDLDCDNISDKDEDYICMLLMAFKYKKNIGFNRAKIPPIASINLNENFTDIHMDFSSDYLDGSIFETSKYIFLKKQDFDTISNLNYIDLLRDIKKFKNKGNYTLCNYMMLEMLKSYDKKKNDILLETVTEVANWLLEKGDCFEVALINLYQCFYRKRKLVKEEEDNLLEIVGNFKNYNTLIVGSYILLGEDKMAERYFNKMEYEEQQKFKNYPIYTLMKNGGY